jgi:hypothetical protein
MARERVVLCGNLTRPEDKTRRTVGLQLWGKAPNVTLKISDISSRMVANIPPVLVDLLEIASYVYCADQATTRGENDADDHGAKWRRRFRFRIPVRAPELWSSDAVLTPLCDTLGFLSDDEYEFNFEKAVNPPELLQYLDFGADGATGFKAEEVVLFSGGIDSLGGAVREAVVEKRKVALVSHRSAPKIFSRQKSLLQTLGEFCATKPFHVPVWVYKEKKLGREFSQRTRSFLYASLAVVVARIFNLWRIRFYENGPVSINLPISAQIVGSRATRTTHPQVLNGFSQLFGSLFQRPFTVENPFIWKTRADVVQSIREAGCGRLLKNSVSCTRVFEMTNIKTHCGTCSQCIDRRFATLSTGCSDDEDPEEMYEVDLLKGARQPGESRTMLESYVRTAKRIKDMPDMSFFSEFGEVNRVTRNIKGYTVDEAASNILDLYKRHAAQIFGVITKGIQDYAEEINGGKVPDSCLLILALEEKYKRQLTSEGMPPIPVLALDEIKDGEANRNLLARIVGSGRYVLVNKKIGPRQLFFTYLLFGSPRALNFDGEHITVVSKDDVIQELQKWRTEGYLQFSGKDQGEPAYRVQKMWGEFVRQIEKEKNLKNLLTDDHKDKDKKRLYGIRLQPNETQILIPSLPALFKMVSG